MTSTLYTIQRRNAVQNPQAAWDVTGWDNATRVTSAPVALPSGVTSALYVGPYVDGQTCTSVKWTLPTGVTSGDWVYAQFEAYVDGVNEGDCALWANLEFYDANESTQGWCAFCRDAAAPLTGFVRYGAVIQVPGVAATSFIVFTKCDEIRVDGADLAELYFTNVSVEKCFARNVDLPPYGDGNYIGWEWSGTAYLSESHESVSQVYKIEDIVEEELTLTGTNSYTFPALDDDYVLEAHFGPSICRVDILAEAGGTADPDGTVYVSSQSDLVLDWEVWDDWAFHDMLVDGVSVSPSGSGTHTFSDVIDHFSVVLKFSLETRTLTYAAGANGSIDGTASQEVDVGSSGSAVTAVPDEGYEFVSWSDDDTSETRVDFNVTENISVTATFALIEATVYDLTYSAGANGTLTGDTSQQVAEGESGTEVIAVADSGYEFTAWSDNSILPAARTDRVVSDDITVSASFSALVVWDVTFVAGANGSITGDLEQVVEDEGRSTLVTAVPNSGYRFTGWSDGSTIAQRRANNVTADVTLTASFAAITTYALAYSAGSGGTISGTASQTVAEGSSGTIVTAVPSSGYTFVAWSDGVLTPARLETNVQAAVTVSASFAAAYHTLSYRAIHGGTIAGANPQTVAHGGSGTTVTATPYANYTFVRWSDGVLTAARTDTPVNASLHANARFAFDAHTLTYTAGSGGTLRGAASQVVRHERHGMPITAVPNEGYHFTEWSDHVTDARRLDLVVLTNITVSAVFAPDA